MFLEEVGGGAGGSPPKDKGNKRLAGKAVEALPAIVGSIVGAILSFLGKTIEFIAEPTWVLIVFVAGIVGWWLMQKVKKS